MVHIPFGHTLEDEGSIRESQWRDDRRVVLWLGNEEQSESTIVKQIKGFLQRSGISESKAATFVEDIRRYIVPPKKTEKSDYPMNLEYPYIVDIVGNTLCADLLDYLDRDMYFCGLRERSGDRVVKYLAIVRVRRLPDTDDQAERFEETSDDSLGKGRVALLAYRIEREHSPGGGSKTVSKTEIKSEAIDLLRRRYALAEKVYFHRTKTAASAMLISATASASLNWEEIFNISDEAFLSKLEASDNPRTKKLIAKYKARQLYRVLYEIRYRPRSDEDEESLDLYDELYLDYRKPSWRTAAEKEIEEIAGFPAGSVVIYCPALGMNLKQFEMLVQNHPGDQIKPLKDILDETRQKEMEAINERFEQLWKLLILVDPDVLDVSTPSDKLSDVNKICEEVMRFSNERTDLVLKGKGRSTDDQIALRVLREYQEQHTGVIVPHDMFEKLVTASRRAERTGRIDQCRKNLEALMKSLE
jgi:HD superfamily phosphohydrolase